MQKILITLPNSIAGTLILKGFKQGFKSNGCFVSDQDLRSLNAEDIKRFKPDIIFGYDYGFMFGDNNEVKNYILENQNSFKLVHYCADEPNGKYAYVNNPNLYNDFKNIKNTINYIWDKEFADDIPNAKYMPLAVNYKAYRTNTDIFSAPKYAISFVGRPLTEKRQKILASLVKAFPNKLNIFCYEKHFLQSLDDMKDKQFLSEEELDTYKSAYKGFLKTEEEIADIYANSTVNINITLQGKSGMNYRVFEVLASRGFLLTDEMDDIKENFVVSKELETYKNVEDLIDKTKFYLKNPEIGRKIALIGFADVIKSHSYTARARQILDDIKNKQDLD